MLLGSLILAKSLVVDAVICILEKQVCTVRPLLFHGSQDRWAKSEEVAFVLRWVLGSFREAG